MMLPLLIIDDVDQAQQLLDHSKRRHLFADLVNVPKDFGRIDDDSTYEALLTWFETGSVGQKGRVPDIAVILDLGLRTGSALTQVWPSIQKRLAGSSPDLASVDEAARDGFAVLHAMKASPWLRTAVVVIASGRAPGGIPDAIDRFKEMFQSEGKFIVCVNKIGRMATNDLAGALLEAAFAEWQVHFGIHDDPIISGLVKQYGAPLRQSATSAVAWRHTGWCDQPVGQEAARALLNSKGLPDPNSVRALFMLDTAAVEFDSEGRSYPLARTVLESALHRLDLQSWTLSQEQEVRLPLPTPGIAFLLAARQLVMELARETAAQSIEFRLDVFSYGLRVNLGAHQHRDPRHSGGGWGCVAAFLKKLRNDNNTWQFPRDGLSGAISDVARCRVSGLRNPQNDPLVSMLTRGLNRWVAWPSFLENSIEFRW